MTEDTAIESSPAPATRDGLAADLRRLGLQPGMVVLVHSSLRALGWVCGGPVAVIEALQDVLSPGGTLVMPAHSGDLSDPKYWGHPPVPRDWWPLIRDTMPAYDPARTPTRGVGRIAELFRTWPGVSRSHHPTDSFAAWGRHAEAIVADHPLELSLGEGSPLARLYDLDGWVLLLGAAYESNTSFHLAEIRAGGFRLVEQGAPIREGDQRVWKTYRNVDYSIDGFAEIGERLESEGLVRRGPVGSSTAKFFHQRPAVDFATRWLAANHRPPA